ncbi:MAG: hypothetical protein RL226_14 [Bacteroidota bacterium]
MKQPTVNTFVPERVKSLWDLPHAVLFWNRDLQCVVSNDKSSFNFTALRGDFITGLSIQELPVKKSSIDYWIQQFQDAGTNKIPVDFTEYQIINGNQFELNTTIIPEMDNEGELLGYSTITVIAGKSIQSKVLNDVWDSLFSNVSETVMIIDDAFRINRLNRSWLQRENAWYVGLNFQNFIPEASKEAFETGIRESVSRKQSFRIETSMTIAEGRLFTIIITPWFEAERLVCYVVVIHDVTDRRQHWKSQMRGFQTVMKAFEISDEAMVVVTQTGQILVSNERAKNLFGKTFIHLDQLHVILHNRLRNIEEHQGFSVENLAILSIMNDAKSRRERFCMLTNDNWEPFESTCQVIPSAPDGLNTFLWTLRSIKTDVARIERLKKLNTRLDSFVQTTAHDVKTPVANLYNLALLLKRSDDDQMRTVLADKIAAASMQLSEMLNSLLELSDVRKNKPPSTEEIALADELKNVLLGFESMITSAKGSIVSDFSLAPSIHFNRAFLDSIMNNLIGNSLKYCKPGVPPIVKISSRPAASGIWLQFEDNGVGIDLYKHGKDLFQPFKRLTSEGEGKGLGLSLVKEFVERVGGEIQVESTPGVGTTFNLLLKNMTEDQSQYSLFDDLPLQDA